MIEKGRVAVVTGAGSGIGKEVALALANKGVKVVALDIKQEMVNETAMEINDARNEAISFAVDVSNKETIDAAMNKVIEKWGKLDILVHCAGILYDCTIKKLAEKDWDRVLNINAKGTYLMMQAAFFRMSENNYGRIVNLASAAYLGNFGQAAYCASKAGVVSLTRVGALEFARKGVTVNAIAPGVVETPMTQAMPPEAFEKLAKQIPVGRVAKAKDIVHIVLSLVDDDASYITGQTILVDGGLTIGASPA